jgi:gamma-glutamyltranspeptidase / glutathione hydrolase
MMRGMDWRLGVWVALAGFASFAAAQPTDPPRARPTRPAGESIGQWQAEGRRGAVVAGGPEAVDAGMAILRADGNAADAAAATLLALSVTDAHEFCFGGEVPILVYDAARGVVEVIDGQGAAPRLATREHFQQAGGIPATGITAATVPAALAACVALVDRYGTMTFADVAAPALQILDRREHPWHENLAQTFRRLIAAEEEAGERKRGLRLVEDYFYRGPIAREIDAWSRANGGLIRYSDLATHATRIEEPVTAIYRGYTVYKCGPWTQGPYLLQALQLLEGFDPADLKDRGAAIHLGVEALKLGLADRDAWYGDPLFETIPLRELLAPRYADARRTLIDRKRASRELRPGDPRTGEPLGDPAAVSHGDTRPARDTTTCLVADGQGNVVAATPSGWSGTLCPPTGIWLGSRLQSFSLGADHPNRLEPGKRPRITLTPTLVLKDGTPVIAVSVAGGDYQDQIALQMLLNVIDRGHSAAEAVTAPRFATDHLIGSFRQASPRLASLIINPGVGDSVIEELRQRGHRVDVRDRPIAQPTVLLIDAASGILQAAGDPKARRHANAF